MLRASIEYQGKKSEQVRGTGSDLRVITQGAKAADIDVEHGAELTAFAEASVQGDAAAIATAPRCTAGRCGLCCTGRCGGRRWKLPTHGSHCRRRWNFTRRVRWHVV